MIEPQYEVPWTNEKLVRVTHLKLRLEPSKKDPVGVWEIEECLGWMENGDLVSVVLPLKNMLYGEHPGKIKRYIMDAARKDGVHAQKLELLKDRTVIYGVPANRAGSAASTRGKHYSSTERGKG